MDVKLVSGNGQMYDLQFEKGDLISDGGLETAVLISLFTDRRVNDSELPEWEEDKRGWFGDTLSDIEGDQYGSKLWTLDRAPLNSTTRTLAEAYARDALSWLLEDGVASDLSVEAYIVNRDRIDLDIAITKPTEKNAVFYRFQLNWDGQLKRGK